MLASQSNIMIILGLLKIQEKEDYTFFLRFIKI